MNKLIDGKKLAQHIIDNISQDVVVLKKKGIVPKLAVVLVGDDAPSEMYVKKKEQLAAKVGIDFCLYKFKKNITQKVLIKNLENIQSDKKLSGLIVQLPVPEHLYTSDVLNAIKPELDVDCLSDVSIGKIVMKTHHMLPPTPAAIMYVLKNLNFKLVGKRVAIIGAGSLVGKPLSIIMMNKRATVTVCNSATKNIKEICLHSDVIISGVGKQNIVRGDMVKKGAIVIDAGICFDDKKMCGDVDIKEVIKKVSYITPTPGGIGPMTVAMLINNTIINAQRKLDKK